MSASEFAGWLGDPTFQAIAHSAMAMLFARSAWHKWRDPVGFRQALAGYGLVRPALQGGLARIFASAETALALSLLVPGLGSGPALAGVGLLCVYTAATVAAWSAGRREIDCGCGPPGSERPIGPALWIRNAVLVALLAAAAAPAASASLGALGWAQVIAATSMACLVYVATEQALANAHRAGALVSEGRLS